LSESIGRLILQLWGLQAILLCVIAGNLWWVDPLAGKSALIGGLLYMIPNVYFTACTFRYRGSQAAIILLRSMYRGEFGKFVLTAVGFALVFIGVKPLDIAVLFLLYIIMVISQLIVVSRWR
jgi:ATP synthase protein I